MRSEAQSAQTLTCEPCTQTHAFSGNAATQYAAFVSDNRTPKGLPKPTPTAKSQSMVKGSAMAKEATVTVPHSLVLGPCQNSMRTAGKPCATKSQALQHPSGKFAAESPVFSKPLVPPQIAQIECGQANRHPYHPSSTERDKTVATPSNNLVSNAKATTKINHHVTEKGRCRYPVLVAIAQRSAHSACHTSMLGSATLFCADIRRKPANTGNATKGSRTFHIRSHGHTL